MGLRLTIQAVNKPEMARKALRNGWSSQPESFTWICKGKTSRHKQKYMLLNPQSSYFFLLMWLVVFMEPVMKYIFTSLLFPLQDWRRREEVTLQARTCNRWPVLLRSPCEDQAQDEHLEIIWCFKTEMSKLLAPLGHFGRMRIVFAHT